MPHNALHFPIDCWLINQSIHLQEDVYGIETHSDIVGYIEIEENTDVSHRELCYDHHYVHDHQTEQEPSVELAGDQSVEWLKETQLRTTGKFDIEHHHSF